jgi:hypothetical protein
MIHSLSHSRAVKGTIQIRNRKDLNPPFEKKGKERREDRYLEWNQNPNSQGYRTSIRCLIAFPHWIKNFKTKSQLD